jgi:putative ABC transport system permease protein
MLTATIKGLLARKRRLFTTALAVTLGVAFMTGTLVLTDTIGKTFDDLFADVNKNTDAVVRAEAAFDGPMGTGTQRGRIDASLVDTVDAVDGVALAQGQIFGYARLLGADGKAIGNPEMGAPTVGVSWPDSQELNPFRLESGRAPEATDEVVIDAKSAKDGDLAVGDTTTVLVQAGPQRVRIAGVAKFGTADSPGGASFTLFERSVAQQLLAEPGRFDSISVIAEPGVSQVELTARLAQVIPDGTEAITGAAATQESQSDMREAFSFFNTFMLVFAVVALVVGGFMIFNTFSITVAQRTRENGLLRALGASRRQVLGSVLAEALVIAALASILGLGAGVLVAGGLKAMLAGFGFDLQTNGLVFTARTALMSSVAGIAVTLIAAASPARKAAKVPPIAAMHAETMGSTGYGSKQRIVVGLSILAIGVTALMAGLFGSIGGNALGVVGGGVLLTFFGVSILGRTVALPLSRVLGAALPRLRGPAGTLARENAMRNPKRTAASASALMIGVGLVAFITILASSTKSSIDAAIDRAVTGDVVVSSGAGFFGGMDPSLAASLNELPEVESATGVRSGFLEVEGDAVVATGLDRQTGFSIIDVDPLQGSVADLGVDAIAVHEDEADERNVSVGDFLAVRFKDTGVKNMRVALIYGENQPPPLQSFMLGMEAWDANFTDRFDAQVLVKAAAGVTPVQAKAAVEAAARPYPGVEVFDQAEYKAEQGRQVDTILALMYAMLALAIVIALLGIGNTLALAIFERTRELGVLRAVGMTRSQLRSTIRWESVIIALQGTALGLVIGVFFGWALVRALEDQGIDRLAIPVPSLAVVVVLAALAGVLAAVAPSRRAARLNVLSAIVSE